MLTSASEGKDGISIAFRAASCCEASAHPRARAAQTWKTVDVLEAPPPDLTFASSQSQNMQTRC